MKEIPIFPVHGLPFRLPTHTIMEAVTSVAAFVGGATQGPSGEAVLVQSWEEFETTFGGLVAGVFLGYAVLQFFENGGSQAYIVRLVGSDAGTMLSPNTEEFEAVLTGPGGYAALAAVSFNLLCVPGQNTAAVVKELQGFCADQRAFLIVDASQSAVVGGGGSTDLGVSGPADGAGVSLAGDGAENSGFYFPWVQASDLLEEGSTVLLPPSGFVAGVMAASDARHGVWKAPAGIGACLTGVLGLQYEVNDAQDGVLNPLGVNCLRQMAAYGFVVWGARTIAGTDANESQWKYVPVRRMALFLQSSLEAGLQWVVFEPNAEPLWNGIRISVETFLEELFRQGAFMGATPDQAFFVKCDADTNLQSGSDAGVVNVTVGFAPLQPAEFVVIQIQLMTPPAG